MHSVFFWFINGGHYACVFVASKWHKHGCYFSKTRPLCCVLVVSISIFVGFFVFDSSWSCVLLLYFDFSFSILTLVYLFLTFVFRFAFVCALVFVSTSVCFRPCVRLWFIPIFILFFWFVFSFLF